VPTTRPRHILTETDELTAALEHAAARWPADRDRPSRLLLHLIETGDRTLTAELEHARAHRRDVIARNAGALAGAYEPGYLAALRSEWPE